MEKKNEPIKCFCKECMKDYTIKVGKNKIFKAKQYSLFKYKEMYEIQIQ